MFVSSVFRCLRLKDGVRIASIILNCGVFAANLDNFFVVIGDVR